MFTHLAHCLHILFPLFPTNILFLIVSVGNDIFWPPNVDDGWQSLSYADSLTSLIGPDGQVDNGCKASPGIYGYPSTFDPYANWLEAYLGGTDLNAYTNIVFSNGLLDPCKHLSTHAHMQHFKLIMHVVLFYEFCWNVATGSAAGVYAGGVVPAPGAYDGPAVVNLTGSGSLQQVILDLGGHHLDLMFSDDNDPKCAEIARQAELDAILSWINEFNAQVVVRNL